VNARVGALADLVAADVVSPTLEVIWKIDAASASCT
jgi:hypothetical protein